MTVAKMPLVASGIPTLPFIGAQRELDLTRLRTMALNIEPDLDNGRIKNMGIYKFLGMWTEGHWLEAS